MSTNEPVESPIEGHIGEDTNLGTLEEGLENNDYTGEQIQQALEAEEHRPQNDDGPRNGARDLLNERFKEATNGPNTDGDADTTVSTEAIRKAADPDEPAAATTAMSVTEDAVDDDGQVRAARAVDGMGATEAGTPGVVLPAPELDSAPDTVRVFTPTKSGIGQSPTPYSVGAHDVPYTRQVKNQLEAETNRLRLDESDSLHPSNDSGDSESE